MPAVRMAGRRERIMFVTPSELSSGEGVTVLQMCLTLTRAGHDVLVLASPFTARILAPRLTGRVRELGPDADINERIWQHALHVFRPHTVVFADYPLLHFSSGVSPLLTDAWLASLSSLDAELVTLDHLGYAQRAMQMHFGPPHLSLHSECTPVPMDRMRVLRPCPMNAPNADASRLGTPFRFATTVRTSSPKERKKTRLAYTAGTSHLVVHTTPNWAWRIAEDWQLPHYPLLDRVLEQLFGTVERAVTVISVNNGTLLAERDTPTLTIRNSGQLQHHEYEALLDAADLLVTDNAISSTIGRVALAGVPAVNLRNRRGLLDIVRGNDTAARQLAYAMEAARLGSVFPFDVYPIWNESDVSMLGLLRNNPVMECVTPVEIYGGASSAECMRATLEDETTRAAITQRQRAYRRQINALPDTLDVLTGTAGRASASAERS